MNAMERGIECESVLDGEFLCAFCAKPATKTCGRCGEFYCSIECQLHDWRMHRTICFPIPQLVSLKSARTEFFIRQSISRTSSSSIGRHREIAAAPVSSEISDNPKSIGSDVDANERPNPEKFDGKIADEGKCTSNNGVESVSDAIDKISLVPRVEAKTVDHNSVAEGKNETSNLVLQAKMLEELVTPVVLEAFPIESNSSVLIVNVKDHQTVYVRQKVTGGERDRYEQLLQLANDAVVHAERPKIRPRVGDMILAPSDELATYGRALVEEINGNEAMLYFFDLGCREMVDAKKTKLMPEAMRRHPCLLNEITLAGVPANATSSQKIVEFLMTLRTYGALLKLKYADGCITKRSSVRICINGELIDATTSISINQSAIELGACVETIIKETPLSLSKDSLNHKPDDNGFELTNIGFSGDDVKVLITDNSMLKAGYISCVRVADTAIFGTNDKLVNDYGAKVQDDEAYIPSELGTVCLARCTEDSRWYRAMLTEKKDGNRFAVIYIDYGNSEVLHAEQIRELHDSLKFPCITVTCFIEGITWMKRKLSKRLLERLDALLPSYEKIQFDKIVYSERENHAVGKIEKIKKILTDEQLIEE